MAAGLPHVFVEAFPERLHQSFVCSAAAVVGWQEMLFKFTSSQGRSIRLLPTRRVTQDHPVSSTSNRDSCLARAHKAAFAHAVYNSS